MTANDETTDTFPSNSEDGNIFLNPSKKANSDIVLSGTSAYSAHEIALDRVVGTISAENKKAAHTTEKANNTESFQIKGVANIGLDYRTMRVLETRIYSLVREVLDVENMNVVRRNLVSLLHQSSRLLFFDTIQKWASAQAKVI